MKCNGNFVFKSLTFRNAGIFKNSEGVDVNFPSAYILKVDEILESGDINERKFKINDTNTMLVNALKRLQPYQKIILDFNLTLYTNRITLEVENVSIDNEYDED